MPNKKRSGKAKKRDPYRALYWIVAMVGAFMILVNLGQAIAALIGVVLLYVGLKYAGAIKG